MKSIKVAIYSGAIPSTIFIERLIEGLSKKGVQVYLFGKINNKIRYSKNVKQFAHSNRFSKFCQLLYYTILLRVKFPQDKRKLDDFIATRNGSVIAMKSKFYPVLYHRPDIFHLQWIKGVAEWIWVEDFNIRLIISLRGTHITISPYANDSLAHEYKVLFPKVSGFHAVSKAIVQSAVKFGLEASKSKIIYSGLNFDQFQFQIKNDQPSKKIKILSIGRSHWVKGYEFALDAMSLLKKIDFPFEYKIIGLGEDESLLFQRSQLNLESEVCFEKNVSFDGVKESIHEANVLLLSSVEEGIANVVLESMALGTLIITTNCGGMEEVVQSDENGIIVPVRDSVAIAGAIVKVSQLKQEEYQRIVLNARTTIEKQHSENKMVDAMQKMYNQVMNQ